ncbi:hypothetical protein [uncultured Brevibacillus sp.]|nr:hypothetical protein [uncultured Brevibacillus sp.]
MKKVLPAICNFFGSLSVLNVSGVLKGGFMYEPTPPHMREEKK